MAAGNLYSNFVAWLKILLPLVALGILSTVVFFASDPDATRDIPFLTEADGTTPTERIGAPEFVSVTSTGSAVTLTAVEIIPEAGNTQRLAASDITGLIETAGGRTLRVLAPDAIVDLAEGVATFSGQVDVTTSDGVNVQTEGLRTRLDEIWAESTGEVRGKSGFGTIRADRMTLDGLGSNGDVLVFNGQVELIYEPGN